MGAAIRVTLLAALLAAGALANAQGVSDEAARAAAVRYRLALLETATRKPDRYPRAAMDAGLEGRTVIRLEFAGSGRMRSVSVHESSGHPILDDAALDTIVDAIGLTRIPPELRGREFSLEIPVIFNIDAKGKP